MLYKIIGMDNFDRESTADFLVCENVANAYIGNIMVEALNNNSGDQGQYFYKLAKADYVLWRGMEELI